MDLDIGTILTVLVAIAAAAGPAIEKMLKKAGQTGKAGTSGGALPSGDDERAGGTPLSRIPSVSPNEESRLPEPSMPDDGAALSAASSPGTAVAGAEQPRGIPAVPPELLEGGYRSVRDIVRERRQKESMNENGTGTSRRPGIDPKKLVIYYEIMKPKWVSGS